ncbi:MAG: peptide deformylase [Vicinamibacterales bacterium]|nr:peptide deformylase [Vicinamibacterales bacterium]
MIRPILRHGAPALHRPAQPVERITDDIQALVDDMVETMHRAPGVGLAAPQVGVDLRVFVVDLSVGTFASDLLVLINPEFVEREGLQLEEEGCLSVPGFSATVARPARVVVRGLDRSGRPVTVEGTRLLARALQHEMDHLAGCLFLDRLRPIRRRLMTRQIRKLQDRGRW